MYILIFLYLFSHNYSFNKNGMFFFHIFFYLISHLFDLYMVIVYSFNMNIYFSVAFIRLTLLCSYVFTLGQSQNIGTNDDYKLVGLSPSWNKLVTHLGVFKPSSTQSLSTYTSSYDIHKYEASEYQVLPTYTESYYKPQYSTVAYQVVRTLWWTLWWISDILYKF